MSYPSHEGEYRITHVIVPASRSPPFTVLCGPLRCDEEYRSLRTVGRVRGDDSERTQASPPPVPSFLSVSPLPLGMYRPYIAVAICSSSLIESISFSSTPLHGTDIKDKLLDIPDMEADRQGYHVSAPKP